MSSVFIVFILAPHSLLFFATFRRRRAEFRAVATIPTLILVFHERIAEI
jgi:hypothetical protein